MNEKQVNNPSFCVIAPTQYLNEYATQSNTHLVLAHLAHTSQEYSDFYRDMSDRGDLVICDNGAYELGQSYSPEKLISIGHACGADVIVLPDYPGQPHFKTIDAAKQWAQTFKEEGFKTLFVPQSEVGEREDWIESYQWASDNDHIDMIGMSILGIPNAIPYVPKIYARVVMTEILHDRGIFDNTKHHHYLGLNSAPNIEIPSLIQTGALNTCDSSNPVWSALNGHRYDTICNDFLRVNKKFLASVDFDYKWVDSPLVHEMIQWNLDVTFDIFSSPEKYI